MYSRGEAGGGGARGGGGGGEVQRGIIRDTRSGHLSVVRIHVQ